MAGGKRINYSKKINYSKSTIPNNIAEIINVIKNKNSKANIPPIKLVKKDQCIF
jgi:hypothetical protein